MKSRSISQSFCIGGVALLVSTAAHARPMSIDSHSSSVYSYDWRDSDPYLFDVLVGSGPYSHSVSSGDSLAASSAGGSGMSALAESYGVVDQAAYVYDVILFTPDTTGPLAIEWDFSGDANGYSSLSIDEVGVSNIFSAGYLSSGSTSVPVTAGVQYQLTGTLFSVDGSPAAWWNVPAPGSAALVGLGGLIAARRRRN